MSTTIQSVCSKDYYKASRTSGTRKLSEVKWIVLHDEEASTAKSAAAWFHNPRTPEEGGPGGSAHLCVDDNICYRCLANEDIPWGAKGANTNGFHIEQAGFAKWSAAIWRKHRRTIQRAAYKAALHCKLFNIPVVFVKADGLKAGRKGITTHRECSKAFGGDHTDPGPLYPTALFMYWARYYYKRMGQ